MFYLPVLMNQLMNSILC